MDYSSVPFVLQQAPKEPTPLALIGGVQTPKTTPPPEFSPFSILKNAFFDWYQCALSIDPETVVAVAESYFREECELVVAKRMVTPQRPYKSAVELFTVSESHEISFCTVHYGGVNEKCMFRCTSDRAEKGAEFVRKYFPEHTVSRLDVAMDFCEGPELFGVLADWLVEFASSCNPKMKIDYRGDWSTASKGRTLYIGSRQSAVFIRLYEKGYQQLALGNVSADPDWIRFEAEIKPEKREGKERLSTVTPEQAFGCSRLLRDFVGFISGDKLEPITVGKVRKMVDHERTMSHLCHQYGAALLEEMEKYDNAETFVSDLLDRIAEQKELRKRTRERLAGIRENFVPSGLTARASSVPGFVPAERSPSPLSPSFLRRYPRLLRHQVYRPVPGGYRSLVFA